MRLNNTYTSISDEIDLAEQYNGPVDSIFTIASILGVALLAKSGMSASPIDVQQRDQMNLKESSLAKLIEEAQDIQENPEYLRLDRVSRTRILAGTFRLLDSVMGPHRG